MTAQGYTDPAAVEALTRAKAAALTPEQQSQIRDCTARIVRARAGGSIDRFIRAHLIAEGWAAGAVIGAFEALERDRMLTELAQSGQEWDAAPAQEAGA